MEKIIVRFGKGSLQEGFPHVIVELKSECGKDREIDGVSLPPNPNLIATYQEWERVYRVSVRLQGRGGTVFHGSPTGVRLRNIEDTKRDLITALNQWLSQGDFASVEAQLRTFLSLDDRISLSIITDDDFVWKLPWHCWKFCKDYEHCVESFSKSNIQSDRHRKLPANGRVNILAIWGDDPKLGLEQDLAALHQPRARVNPRKPFKPKSALEISDMLAQQKLIHLLFFGGHGETIELELEHETQTVGKIFLDKATSISISKIKADLRQAIECGLQIAIFNCCSGLGLAEELADLNIPYLIVMRSQLPDKLAQQFCSDLLGTYSKGGDFTAAFHYARGRLVPATDRDDELESWLPMLVHNPNSQRVTWADLSRSWWQRPTPESVVKARRELTKPDRLPLTWIGISLLSTAITMGLQTLAPVKELESKAIERLQFAQANWMPTKSRVVVIDINEPVKDDAVSVVVKPEGGKYIIDEEQLQDLSSNSFSALGLDVQLNRDEQSSSWLENDKNRVSFNCDDRSPDMIYLPPINGNCSALAWKIAKNASQSSKSKLAIILNPYLTPKIEKKLLSDIKNSSDFLKDKIVLVGYVEDRYSSVMIHATAADAIASDRPLLVSYIDSIGNVYLLLWASISAASIFYGRRLFPTAIAIVGGSVGTGTLLFMSGYLVPFVPVTIGVGISFYLVYSIKKPTKSI